MVRICLLIMSVVLFGCSAEGRIDQSPTEDNSMSARELIIVAAPRHNDPYYAEVAADIFDFHIAYAEQVAGHDDFLVLTDARSAPAYIDALGDDRVAIAPQDDIWMRDFSLSNAEDPILFRYTAEGQGGGREGQSEADHVQDQLAIVMEGAELGFTETDWLNDGGNFVDDYAGRAVLSRKFLRDNALNEAEAREILRDSFGLIEIAFIEADEQGGLEHSDGVVAFIDANTLVVNAYPEDPDYAATLIADLRAGLPGVTIHTLTTPYDGSQIYDARFGSACGLYTNMLVTPERIYLPQFGIVQDDEALQAVRGWTDKTVIPVQSGGVCGMGGGVRCMSWQLRGENADRLRAWASTR